MHFSALQEGKNLTVSSGKPNCLTWATYTETPTRESSATPCQHPKEGFVSPQWAPSKHSCSLVLVHQFEMKTENMWIKIPPPQNAEKT